MTDILALAIEPWVSVPVTLALAMIIWLIYGFEQTIEVEEAPLSEADQENIIRQWKPKAMIPTLPISKQISFDHPVTISATGPVIIAEDGQEYLNFTSGNYLGLAALPQVKQIAQNAVIQYGVGSCGPRGFYGTIDVHLQLEQTFAKFMGGTKNECILYSDYMACLASVIPAFAKKGDYIVADNNVDVGIQQGLRLSRSHISYFDHNNLQSLEQQLQQIDQTICKEDRLLLRRFIVIEGIYLRTGQICPLAQITALAQRYKFRIIIDDSHALGVLGTTGRGSFEHAGVQFDGTVHILCASLGHSVSGVGAVCVAEHRIVNHQRLSGLGYCYSAASPPYTAQVGTYILGLIDSNAIMLVRTAQRIFSQFYDIFIQSYGPNQLNAPLLLQSHRYSPLFVLRPRPTLLRSIWNADSSHDDILYTTLFNIVEQLRSDHNILISLQHHANQEIICNDHGIRFQFTMLHSVTDVQLAVDVLSQVMNNILYQKQSDNNSKVLSTEIDAKKCDIEQLVPPTI